MNKSLTITLSDEELIDLYRIILDRDEAGAWAFLDTHLKKGIQRALEGG